MAIPCSNSTEAADYAINYVKWTKAGPIHSPWQ